MSSLIEQATQRLEQLRQAGASMEDANLPPQPVVGTAETTQRVRKSSPAITGNIDLEALQRCGIVSPNAPRSPIGDQFRVIKRPLIRNAMAQGAASIAKGNLVMVTSAVQGEGKTFTAINLAMSVVNELDCTVMLVDADVAHPSVMDVLGLPAGLGLLDLLQDPALDLSDMLVRTNVDKLSILSSGTSHPRATELLASDAMARLLQEMASRYTDRIIIFDSPPLLLATESRVLASHMGQIVMVVKAEQTLQSDVVQALSTIDACPVKWMVLNQARNRPRLGYHYTYGYEHEPVPVAA